MNDSRGRQILIMCFLFAIAIATWDEIHNQKRVPVPKRYVGTGVFYGLVGFVAPFIGYQVAALFGTGILIALIYKTFKAPKETLEPAGNTTGANEGSGIGGAIPQMGSGTNVND